ncbi:hypothetical protein D8Y22_01625 [Salinadaptatus halalkaliphilus]|uniref:Cbb3-type cytochrome c oxidase subunit I n=1 Tax=Salinadaptatus halalkaliphilus TaxID=2419781 RepID=A0A4S3TR86_9EURY|nr:hypothetical protein [Salinadaptatus halalkaliphilus]THE66846.1 hypothetical protein D8Y22_01625 [Salinadaptatus halalkaliphilus]
MNGIPGGLRTDQQPPMAIPLRHFVVGLGFLVVGVGGATVMAMATLPGLSGVAHVHVTLLGWIGLTIMGAMTQFVPVWSGVSIHSRGLARVQLWLVAGGLVGFVVALLAGTLAWLPVVAAPILLGLWLFVYNVGRTLAAARPLDFTERHFAFALGCFGLLAPLGYLLALDFAMSVFDGTAVGRGDVLLVHATLALYGAVLATIVGALAQLVTMFAQYEPGALENALYRLEEPLFPVGVLMLALGRGLGVEPIARVGAVAVLIGLFGFAVAIARLLGRATAGRSPMTDRYWIVVASLITWLSLTTSAWVLEPTGYAGLFGHPDAMNVLVVGVFGFVVVGSLYHIVPFIVWLESYSDRLGFEQVPMIDDCYDDRLERADFGLTVVGFLGLAGGPVFALPTAVTVVGGALATMGFCLFVVNMLLTIHRHGPNGIGGVLVDRGDSTPPEGASDEGSHPAE